MTLPNFLEFEAFNQLRRLMNAALPEDYSSGYIISCLTHDDLDKALEGLDGVIVDDISQIQPLPDGTLAYRDRRILLYIRDKRAFTRHNSQQVLPKVSCSEL